MKTFKKIGLVSAVAFALFAFNACGDDSGSTSASGENGSLSSAVEDDESSSSINDNSSSSVIPGSSSSVIPSDSEGSSSSVKGSDTADVSSSSVIPDPDRESSSSSVKSSSSSAKSSSSVSSSSSVKSSSSSSVKSSSSVASSSSYTPFIHKSQFLTDSLKTGAYKLFEDPRDHREYWYIKIKGKNRSGAVDSVTVFAHNLNYAEKIVDGELDQTDDESHEKYCFDNDTTMCDRYGGLYQWAEAMDLPSECNAKACASRITPDHRGICPDGWRLMNYDDYYIIVKSTDQYSEAMRSQGGFYGSNRTGFSGTGAGYRQSSKKQFAARLRVMGWYYPGEMEEDGVIYPRKGSLSTTKDGWQTEDAAANDTKLDGYSVRCVMVNQE